MKNLVAAGDSFIYGTELKDQTPGRYSRSTYPALLAKHLGVSYTCVAWPGSANGSIARRVIDYCETHRDLDNRVFVTWTFPNRYEFRFSNPTGHSEDRWESLTPWLLTSESDIRRQVRGQGEDAVAHQLETNRKLTQSGVRGFAREFWMAVGDSEYWEIYATLMEVTRLQNYLKMRDIPYLFTFADSSLFKSHTFNGSDTSIRSLISQLDRTHIHMFPGNKGFYDWSLDDKYTIGASHPLEAAHVAAADFFRGVVYELVSKNI